MSADGGTTRCRDFVDDPLDTNLQCPTLESLHRKREQKIDTPRENGHGIRERFCAFIFVQNLRWIVQAPMRERRLSRHGRASFLRAIANRDDEIPATV